MDWCLVWILMIPKPKLFSPKYEFNKSFYVRKGNYQLNATCCTRERLVKVDISVLRVDSTRSTRHHLHKNSLQSWYIQKPGYTHCPSFWRCDVTLSKSGPFLELCKQYSHGLARASHCSTVDASIRKKTKLHVTGNFVELIHTCT